MALVVKTLPTNAGDLSHEFNPWVRKIPRVENGNPL